MKLSRLACGVWIVLMFVGSAAPLAAQDPAPPAPITTETKPEEVEPAEAKPEEAKPEETKPEETKPAEAKPDEPLPGHSLHSEAFNEGPRQGAYLMEGMGRVKFPVTTKSEEAQKFIHQGVGQLHGFWYFEAERSFRQAAALDADCAMAYWGMAMANANNEKRAKEFIAEAVKR